VSRLSDLVRQVAQLDDQLAKDLRTEVGALERRRAFGLNFERHTPESVELYGRPVRRADRVRMLPKRGEPGSNLDRRTWEVKRLRHGVALLADGERQAECRVSDLVVVAEFSDRIYPGLVSTGKVERGGDKPFHTVISAENFHALEALAYTHENKVDAIYLDPPYNTGARDWKYNNDYVDGDDIYRHSKWLAFMERRLKIAKRLLNPENSALIVTIDEKEYLRLGLLLQQTFPEYDTQMVSAVINRAGSPRAGRFSRVDEYVYYVFVGGSQVHPWTATMLDDDGGLGEAPKMPTVWFTAVRRGSGASRAESKNLFYPIVIDAVTGRFRRVGDPLPKGVDRHTVALGDDEIAIWPLGADGKETRWRFSADLMRQYFAAGTARLGKRDPVTGLRPVTYLQPGTLANIENGTFVVTGRSPEGAVELALADGGAKSVAPRTVWNRTSHFARDHGSHLNAALVPGRRFPFPKALYAVEDALRFVVADKPSAVVVDFFAGSGTTAHAVMRLNRQDGGRRQCISVTNNEVSAEEQKSLREQGLRPGDAEWERHGICDYITKPRIKAAITGRTPEGQPIKGEYKFTDEFPMSLGFEENAEFFTLTYEDRLKIAHRQHFERLAPLLWLKAGACGRRIEQPTQDFAVADTYAILFDLDASHGFLEVVAQSEGLRMVFVVTDDERAYQGIVAELPSHLGTERLYGSYLTEMDRGPQVD